MMDAIDNRLSRVAGLNASEDSSLMQYDINCELTEILKDIKSLIDNPRKAGSK
jgi:hypothetical protein